MMKTRTKPQLVPVEDTIIRKTAYLWLRDVDRLRECMSFSLTPVEDKASNIQSNT